MPLSISLMGPVDIRIDGAPMEVDTRKAVAILAYLAVEGGSHPRDRFVDLLWPDTDVDRARSSLRRTLSTVRSALGGRWVEADRSHVFLDRTDVIFDIDAFTTTAVAEHAHPGTHPCDRCIPDLSDALRAHRGRFMDGFAVRGAAPFEMWSIAREEILNQQLDAAYRRLAMAYATEGSYAHACRVTERRITIDPLREDAYRSLMLLHAWDGDRSSAVDTYRRLVGILQTELGVPPLEETTEFYDAILEEDLPRAPARTSTPRPVESPRPQPLSMVGRDSELETALLHATTNGGTCTVEGPAGMGVSRLLDEVARRAQGRTVLRGRGSAAGANVPYGVIHDALFTAIDAPETREAIGKLPSSVLAEAGRLFPALSAGDAPPDAQSPTRLLDALARIVGTIPAPLLIVDDLQLADPASVLAIVFLATRSDRLGLSTLVGITTTERHASDPLAWRDLRTMGSRIELVPLDFDAVAALADEAGGTVDAMELREATGGVPMFLIEALRTDDPATPHSDLRRIIADRVTALGGTATQVFEALAVIGRPCEPLLLATVSGRSPDETDEALDDLASRGLVTEENDAVGVAHPLIATVVSEAMTAARRRLLNRRAARNLESTSRGRLEPARVAQHYALAGSDADAADWFMRAGDHATSLLAHDEAITHYDAALAAGTVDRAGAFRSIGHCAMMSGAYDRAIAAFEASLAAGATQIAAIEHRLGEIARRLRRWDLAAAHLTNALQADPDTETQSIVTADLAFVEARRARPHADLVDDSIALATACGSRSALARAENIAGLLAADDEARRDHLQRALGLAEDPAQRVAVLNNLAAVTAPAEAVDLARQALGLASDLADRHLIAALNNTLADALHAAGRTDESIGALTEAVTIFTNITADGDEPWVPDVWFLTEW